MVLGFSEICYNTLALHFTCFSLKSTAHFSLLSLRASTRYQCIHLLLDTFFLGLFPANLNEIHTCQNTCKPAKVIVLATQGSWPNTCYRHHLVPLSTSDCKIQYNLSVPISSQKFRLLGELVVAFGQGIQAFNLAFEHTFYEKS
jgi:hypothetical protein